ncbi:MAG: primosomal protein [Cryomorphaceae bacterium]|jgi:hypothetical protein|nr:primosomal protein [Cryomorphaceae bacterium]
MRLITEITENIEYITETINGKKSLYIHGPFMMAEVKNKNGRVYPKEILMKEIQRYNENYVNKKRAFGELGHPDGPGINLERVSHMITELEEDGNNVIGKAKIMDTPYGKIVQNLIENGAQLGVSSRGMGSLEEKGGTKYVKDDFYLATAADIVADPSAPEAFVQGIMEGKEWVWESGVIKEKALSFIKKEINKSSSIKLENVKLKAFNSFLSNL